MCNKYRVGQAMVGVLGGIAMMVASGRRWRVSISRRPGFAAIAMLGCLLSAVEATSAEPLKVGFAEVDITPPAGYRKGGGYGEVISTGVHDPLQCKAIVLRQGKVSAALVINDLLSVPWELSLQARRRVAGLTGMPIEAIVVAATHNHGSPEYWGSLRDLAHEDSLARLGADPHETIDYGAKLVESCGQAVRLAWGRAQPCRVQFVDARQPGLAFNRRFHMRDGTVRFNPGVGNQEIVRPAGPVDEGLPILMFRKQTEQAEPVGALTTFALHTAVAGGTEFTADFPAVLQERLRKAFGGEFISLFAEGAAGDINHIDVTNTNALRGRAEVNRIGDMLAKTFLENVGQAKELSEPSLAVASRTVQVPFLPVDQARFDEAIRQLRTQETNRLPFLELVAAWRDCHRYRHGKEHGDRKPLLVQAIRVDRDTAILTLPHEIFVEIGLAIQAASPFRHTIVISLANGVDYYIPTRKAFEEGSYEVTTCPLLPGCGELLADAAREALGELKNDPSAK